MLHIRYRICSFCQGNSGMNHVLERRVCRERNLKFGPQSAPEVTSEVGHLRSRGQILKSAPGRGVFAYNTPTRSLYSCSGSVYHQEITSEFLFLETSGKRLIFAGKLQKNFCFRGDLIRHWEGYYLPKRANCNLIE